MAAIENPLGNALLLAAMTLPGVFSPAHAESAPERGFVSFKYLDYQDRQPDVDRIRVKAPSLMVMQPLSAQWSASGTLIADSISGASPAYHTSGLGQMHDYRKAADLSVTHYSAQGALTLGMSYSTERDYLARGLSAVLARSDEKKNTTWTSGISVSNDVINPTNHVVENEWKKSTDFLLGVTQVVGPFDIAQLNMTYYTGHGYFSDPYKVLDQRPREKQSLAVQGRWNHHFEPMDGTVRWGYRFYKNSWGITAHTLDIEYVKNLRNGWTVSPSVRAYTQSAASFYVPADPNAGIFAPNPPADAKFFSEDQRVSAFGAYTMGIKLAKEISKDTVLDVKVERYEQRAAWRWGGSGSLGLAPFYARNIYLGATHWF